jgi:hypothetical protein
MSRKLCARQNGRLHTSAVGFLIDGRLMIVSSESRIIQF